MASFSKLPSGKIRASVEVGPIRRTASFPTKGQARAWATQTEADIRAGIAGKFPRKTFTEAIDRYLDDVSSKKEGERWELLRLEALKRDFPALCRMVLHEIQTPDMVTWRDKRLETVSKGTVQREVSLLSAIFKTAQREWRWCGESPFTGMRMPGQNPARVRRIPWQESKRILRRFGYRTGVPPKCKDHEIGWAFLLALRSGMRIGEILSLSDARVDFASSVASVEHKMQYVTGAERSVPLTPQMMRLLGVLRGRGNYFTISERSRDARFRFVIDQMLIEGLHFHDTRGEALTLLARKVDVMTLSRISGIKNLRTLLDHYYRESAADIAKRMVKKVSKPNASSVSLPTQESLFGTSGGHDD